MKIAKEMKADIIAKAQMYAMEEADKLEAEIMQKAEEEATLEAE